MFIQLLYEHRLCATAVVFYYLGKSVLVENRPLNKLFIDVKCCEGVTLQGVT